MPYRPACGAPRLDVHPRPVKQPHAIVALERDELRHRPCTGFDLEPQLAVGVGRHQHHRPHDFVNLTSRTDRGSRLNVVAVESSASGLMVEEPGWITNCCAL